MKSVLISINPKWCELIASGKKTVEIRKTKPKIETPFKCYIYCTLSGSIEFFKEDCKGDVAKWNRSGMALKKGKVIGEFVCDDIINIKPFGIPDIREFENQTCLKSNEIVNYLNGFYGYGWHISDLVIYDNQKRLQDFHKPCEDIKNCLNKNFREAGNSLDKCFDCGCRITRPPQSWCYAEGCVGK